MKEKVEEGDGGEVLIATLKAAAWRLCLNGQAAQTRSRFPSNDFTAPGSPETPKDLLFLGIIQPTFETLDSIEKCCPVPLVLSARTSKCLEWTVDG